VWKECKIVETYLSSATISEQGTPGNASGENDGDRVDRVVVIAVAVLTGVSTAVDDRMSPSIHGDRLIILLSM